MKILIVAYDPNWGNVFEAERQRLNSVLDRYIPEVEHIGSTSVAQLAAKPVIDIMIRLGKDRDIDETIPLIQGLGYVYVRTYEDDIPFRRFFIKLDPERCEERIPTIIEKNEPIPAYVNHSRTHQIHLLPRENDWWDRHLLFRDYLRKYPASRIAYEKLKLELARKDWKRSNDYAQAKTDFVIRIEKLALAEKRK